MITDVTIVQLQPTELLQHPANRAVTDERLAELQASMSTDLKLLQPPVVVPTEDGGHRIIVGQSRVKAAEALGWPTLPCILREDLTDAKALLALWEDNETHAHFTTAERAAIDAELALFPEFDTPTKLARATRRKTHHVEGSLAVHRLGPAAAHAIDTQQLTLDDAVELSELNESDPDTAQVILASGRSQQIRYMLAKVHRKRNRARLLEEAHRKLSAEGVAVVPAPRGFPHSSEAAPLDNLRTADGEEIDAELVRTQEGFGAVVDFVHPITSARITYVCLHPEAMGFTRATGSYRTPEQLQAIEEERAYLNEQREQLETAAEVRAKWLVRNLSTQTKAAAWLDDTLRILATHLVDLEGSDLADRLCGAPPAVGTASARKAAHRVIALTVAALHQTASQPESRDDAAIIDTFYRLLWSHGYVLTEAEDEHHQRCHHLLSPRPASGPGANPADGTEPAEEHLA